MKGLFLSFIALMSLSFAKAGNLDTLYVQTKTYCDHCNVCESCWPRMEKEIVFSKGVKKVSFDDVSMKIMVVYNTKKITPEKIRQTIAESGFDADEVKAKPLAVDKLDECCKKK